MKAFPSLDDSMTVVGTISLHLAQIHLLLVVILFFFFPPMLPLSGWGRSRKEQPPGWSPFSYPGALLCARALFAVAE